MGLNKLVQSRFYKGFMAKLYGWGAAIVIVGALFKITHISGANEMLFIGMLTEAIIFFFSAFEPPHVEPDWSLVYPELAGMYHGKSKGKGKGEKAATGASPVKELDKMLENAKIDSKLIEDLGKGLTNLSNTTNTLADVSNAKVAGDKLAKSMNTASESADKLSKAYQDTAASMNKDLAGTESFLKNVQEAAKAAGNLSETYQKAAQAVTHKNKAYDETFEKLTKNLAALNTVYEMQLKNSDSQSKVASQMGNALDAFMKNMKESIATTENYKQQADALTKNVAALNTVYGNMLAAMNVKAK
ncbi:MAG: gliding motility protein GldL [Bacteroidetes bacterium]|nr:MAG: gliding motility protein GldL [Bacteroidota bacterium]PIE88637.1 MAG: gliding motility protein GldL [Bacteroidota bacterium]